LSLSAIIVSPGTATVNPGGSRQFSAQGLWSDGSTSTASVIWQTNGGAMTTSGLYLAPQASGTYKVIATDLSGVKADTATVTVSSGTVVSLKLSPDPATLQPGKTQQFSATATYSTGLTGSTPVSWSSTGGSISSSGLYTAGSTAGTYRVIAQASNSTVKDTATVTIANATVTRLVMSPSSVSLVPGGRQQFSTSATWSDAVSRSVTLSYTATGGTISSSGLYTAGTTTGSYRVIVGCASGCSLKDTSTVTIQPASGSTVSSLTISPKTLTVDIGQVYLFKVTAKLTDGTTQTSPTVTWSATGGAINGTGQYRAPRTAGTYTVTVRNSSGISDDAVVTVKVPTGPYFTDNFDNCTLSKVPNAQGFYWRDTGGGTSIEVPVISKAIAHSGTCSLKFTFGGGPSGDDAWSEQRFRLGRLLSEVYLRWYQYFPSGAVTGLGPKYVHRDDVGSDNNKFLKLWDEDYLNYKLSAGFSTNPTSGGNSVMIPEYGNNGHGVGLFGQQYDLYGITDARRGRWIRVDIHVKTATAANNDGVIEMWVDGVKTISNTHLPMYPEGGVGNYIKSGYLMGWSNSGFNLTSSTWIDDFTISGIPIP
jgi:hypothetical protein